MNLCKHHYVSGLRGGGGEVLHKNYGHEILVRRLSDNYECFNQDVGLGE